MLGGFAPPVAFLPLPYVASGLIPLGWRCAQGVGCAFLRRLDSPLAYQSIILQCSIVIPGDSYEASIYHDTINNIITIRLFVRGVSIIDGWLCSLESRFAWCITPFHTYDTRAGSWIVHLLVLHSVLIVKMPNPLPVLPLVLPLVRLAGTMVWMTRTVRYATRLQAEKALAAGHGSRLTETVMLGVQRINEDEVR